MKLSLAPAGIFSSFQPTGFPLRIWRYFLASIAEESADYEVLEKEFLNVIDKENATISKICFAYAGSVTEYDDLRQDALINIWRGIKQFRGEASRKTWIYRVTVNSCLSTIRREKRFSHEELDGLYGLIEEEGEDRERVELLHRIINSLSSQDKAIIMMWLDEISYDEIAVAMGLNRNTVATRLRRIKEKIGIQYKNLSDFR